MTAGHVTKIALTNAATAHLRSFHEPTEGPARPRVIVSSTASLDGRITLSKPERLLKPDVDRRWKSLWPPDVPELIAERAANIEERHHPTVFLEGSGTFVADTAGTVTGIAGQHDPSDLRRDWLPKLAPKWFAVVDGRGRVPWSLTRNADVSLLVLVSACTPLAYLAWLRKLEVPYLLAGDDRVDLCLALKKMGHLLGATCVVSEGGGGINGALLRSGLVDEIQMIWFPAVIGGADTPSAFDGDPLTPEEVPLSMTHCGTVIGRHGSIWSRCETAAGAADAAMTAGSADTANAARQVNDASGSAAASGTDRQAHSSGSRTG